MWNLRGCLKSIVFDPSCVLSETQPVLLRLMPQSLESFLPVYFNVHIFKCNWKVHTAVICWSSFWSRAVYTFLWLPCFCELESDTSQRILGMLVGKTLLNRLSKVSARTFLCGRPVFQSPRHWSIKAILVPTVNNLRRHCWLKQTDICCNYTHDFEEHISQQSNANVLAVAPTEMWPGLRHWNFV